MAWVADSLASQFPLTVVTKQQWSIPASSKFTALPKKHVPRVYQLAAVAAQDEVVEILREMLYGILDVDAFWSIRYAWQAELSILIDIVLFFGSTWRCAQTVGDRMQNLVFRDEAKAQWLGQADILILQPSLSASRPKLLAYGVLSIFVPYVVQKLNRVALEENWEFRDANSIKAKLARLLKRVSLIWTVISFLHMLHFLATGQYRTIVERLLSLRLVHGSQKVYRFTNLSYLNQNVYFQAWSSFLAVLNVSRYIPRLRRSLRSVIARGGDASLDGNLCCACHNTPTIAQRSNCGHLYCYYCIKGRLADATKTFSCFHCGEQVHTSAPAN
ncbi:Pex2 Pex12 amino terminal region [Trypanosoma vivax]|uniref:RING-type E3 ubiquitin transferase (cysteine targeting) n=1 Tax=Trypanosoma vivax (strain Y486) TaxID=1055687 RepID=G0TSQ3_TRYVY|nr:Pex2 Pex12 amino terminal region [Trypanosoma vivax]CCC46981.1 putative glycosome import protein (gim1) [Trypanosoma vivax Y486]